MRIVKKILKITGIISMVLLIVLYILFYRFTAPKSDENVLEEFKELGISPKITKEKFKTFDYRKVIVLNDTSLPTIVFVHGTIGSVLDFKEFMADSLLKKKANMIIYDRIGYNYEDQNDVQESIAFEVEMLECVIEDLDPEQTILAGYSYGGPIALASKKKYRKVILFAPAVYSKVEPMPWMLNLYKWKLTRWIVPPIWKQASKEKISHPKDLENFEKSWQENPNNVVSVHGDADWIVPYSNSEYLESIFPSDQFKLVTISDANHGFIWSRFEELKEIIVNELE